MSNNTIVNSSGSGISLGGILTILFVILKVTHLINWSWWWVFAPIWIPASLFVMFVGFIFLFGLAVFLNTKGK